MKLMTLRAVTEEQKAEQAIQIRLWAVVLISMIFMLATFSVYLTIIGQTMASHSDMQLLFFIALISEVISIAPNIMKYSWKQIVIRSAATAIFVGLIFSAISRFI
jgi:hypothetical protein